MGCFRAERRACRFYATTLLAPVPTQTRRQRCLADCRAWKGGEEDSPEEYLVAAARYVEEQYAGKKSVLRPSFDELLTLGKSLGTDVKACRCKTMVPLYRNQVFAQSNPTINTGIDFGLCFTTYKGKLPKHLIDTGGLAKKDRITHRLELTSPEPIGCFMKLPLANDRGVYASRRLLCGREPQEFSGRQHPMA